MKNISLDTEYEPVMAVIFTVIFIILIKARMDKEKGGWFGIMENPFVFAILLIVPVMMHAWHLMFGEGSIVEYGGTTVFSLFSIETSEWINTSNFMKDGLELNGALLNTYEVTVSLYMLVAYSIVHLNYKDSRWLVDPVGEYTDSASPGITFILYFFLLYSGIITATMYFLGIPTFSEDYIRLDWQWMVLDVQAFLATLYVLIRLWRNG